MSRPTAEERNNTGGAEATSSQQPTGSAITAIVTDFDGILTDNRVLIYADGTEAVWCNRADGLACDVLRERGIAVSILSSETDGVVTARGRKLRVECVSGVADKGSAMRELIARLDLDPSEVLFVGHDLNDIPAAQVAGWVAAPSDAHRHFIELADHVVDCAGGMGVLRAVVADTDDGLTPWYFSGYFSGHSSGHSQGGDGPAGPADT